MSQKKVDKYKEYKKNRQEILKKEKKVKKLKIAAAWLCVAVFVAGLGTAIGVSFYNSYQQKLAALPTYKTTDFVLGDAAGIQEEAEAAEEESTEEVSTEEESTEEAGSEEESTEAVTEEAATEEAASQSQE